MISKEHESNVGDKEIALSTDSFHLIHSGSQPGE